MEDKQILAINKERKINKMFTIEEKEFRKVWPLIGVVGEFLYRLEEEIPQDVCDECLTKPHKKWLDKWRMSWEESCEDEAGVMWEEEILEGMKEATEYLTGGEFKQFLQMIQEGKVYEEGKYLIEHMNEEMINKINKFIKNEERIEIW